MNESSTVTLAALYPLENRRLLKNYGRFVEDNPDWLELGLCLGDYKSKRNVPGLSSWESREHRDGAGGMS